MTETADTDILQAAPGQERSAVLAAQDAPRWRPGERLEHLFEARCDALPADALAIDGPAGRISYRELDARANRLARHLIRRVQLDPGSRVALLLDRPADAYAAMLGVLKAAGVYIPLDATLPPERVRFILEDARAEAVISVRGLEDSLTEVPGPVRRLYLDELELDGESPDRLGRHETRPAPDELCYVIYTSGTTGRPKGVAVSHPSICNFVRVAGEEYGVRSEDRMYQGLTIAFDFSVEEIWVAWMAGATLVPRPGPAPLVGEELQAFLREQRISALCAVPTLLGTLEPPLPDLRFLLVSGEACPPDLVRRWHRPGLRFLNVYGPTEATVTATWSQLSPARPVTIGVPLPTYSAVVLDTDTDRVLSQGEVGELGLAGIGLADGYLGRPELTAGTFIPDFLGLPHNPSGRIYRTGDLVRLGRSGQLEHLGRIDTQVKLRGYRIELEEIEAVLRSAPGVAQAVAATHEPLPGLVELAAYYTARAGAVPSTDELLAHLRQRLPAYMVPVYLEPVDSIPLMASGKLDRRALPVPSGRRLAAPADDHVPAATALESVLAGELGLVLGTGPVSVEGHFFEALGANSLLMARFAARLRRHPALARPVSMRDIYLHPTVRRLAAALEDGAWELAGAAPWSDPDLPEAVGTPHHLLCGALQMLFALLGLTLTAGVVDGLAGWIFAGSGIGLLGRAVVAGVATLFGLGLLPILAKWVLIGRWRPQRIRIWSLSYLRFWIVKTVSVLNPLPHLLVDTPLYPVYLRAMGAQIGDGVLILSQHIPVCCDGLQIGADSVISRDAYFNGYRARGDVIEIGPIRLGQGVFVGERAVLDIETAMGDRAQLGHSSSLQAGQTVPGGACWHGSPAQPAEAGCDYRVVPPVRASRLRHVRYGLGRLVMLLLLIGPLEAMLAASGIGHPGWIERLSLPGLLLLPAGLVFGAVLICLTVAVGASRLLARSLEPGRTYPLYGRHYSFQRLIGLTSRNALLTGLFGDSVLIVHYLRALGYRFGVIEQTGSNFGLDVKQDVPTLSHVGTGTMASDGLSIINAEYSSSSFRVRPVVIGKRNYLGNAISFPADARTGDNVLFATKAMVPRTGPVRHDVGLLGSPPLEIPRSVTRDRQFDHLLDPAERGRRLAAKTRHNLVTIALHLLLEYLLVLGWLAVASAPLGGTGLVGWAGSALSALLDIGLMLTLFVAAERAVTGFRRLSPRSCSILQIEFWRHERYWKVAPTTYVRLLDGTPFKPLLWRLLGVPIGRRVFDDGLTITERTLVRIGDGATFNAGSSLQSHTLEDGAFKSDMITVEPRATVGTAALVNYDVVVGTGAVVETDAFVMKGSRIEPETRWRGNPATEVSLPRSPLPDEPADFTDTSDWDGEEPAGASPAPVPL